MITQRLGPVLYAHYKLLSKITEALCGSRQPYLLLVSTARTDLHNRYDGIFVGPLFLWVQAAIFAAGKHCSHRPA